MSYFSNKISRLLRHFKSKISARYCAIAVFEALQEHYCEEGQDLFSQFDFVAGTSVGGMGSYLLSLYNSKGYDTNGVLAEGRNMMDLTKEKSFRKLTPLNLLSCNPMIEEGIQPVDFLKDHFDIPLRNPNCIPTMTLISSIKDSENEYSLEGESFGHCETWCIEPLIARTYEYPSQTQSSRHFQNDRKNKPLAYSSCDMRLYEAMAATTAVPLFMDSIQAKVDGKIRTMADGGMLQNCPLSLAIDEARRLYSHRPIGVILNVGYSEEEEKFIHRTIETTRLVHPDLHFQRIAPHDIMKNFSSVETNARVIATMEARVKHWVLNTPRVRNLTTATMKRLFQSPPRSFGKQGGEKVKSIELDSDSLKQYIRRSKITSTAEKKLKRYNSIESAACSFYSDATMLSKMFSESFDC